MWRITKIAVALLIGIVLFAWLVAELAWLSISLMAVGT